MNKYELALVVNAKIEDEARNAVVESCKDIVANAGGLRLIRIPDIPTRHSRPVHSMDRRLLHRVLLNMVSRMHHNILSRLDTTPQIRSTTEFTVSLTTRITDIRILSRAIIPTPQAA